MSICPQRILKEAVDLLENQEPVNDEESERIDNNILELKDLSDKLYKMNITNV